MTRDEILKMPAGREMDVEIARIFGSPELWFLGNVKHDGLEWYVGPKFSRDIDAAWVIAEKFASDGWEVTVEKSTIDGLEKLAWRCWLNYFTDNPEEHRNAEGVDNRASLAICRAALLTTLEEQ